MLWKDKLNEWKSGIPLSYPKNIKDRFFYETSVITKNMDSKYKENFIINNSLPDIQDYSSYQTYIIKSKNKYVISFPNLSGDSILIIPVPRKNKKMTTIKDFIDNASLTHQKYFWKYVGMEIEQILNTNDKIYVSTHGLGIPYFHLRLDKIPKYYQTKSFIL